MLKSAFSFHSILWVMIVYNIFPCITQEGSGRGFVLVLIFLLEIYTSGIEENSISLGFRSPSFNNKKDKKVSSVT